jgi:hypothetical protein
MIQERNRQGVYVKDIAADSYRVNRFCPRIDSGFPRFQLHFTPTGGSWLDLVERWFALLTEKQLRRRAHRSTRELEDAIRAYLEHHNRHPKPSSGPKLLTKSSNRRQIW